MFLEGVGSVDISCQLNDLIIIGVLSEAGRGQLSAIRVKLN